MAERARKPAPPADLGPRGRAFWRSVVGVYGLNTDELELLREVTRCLDEVEALHAVVVEQGHTVAGSRGQVRAHPALAELRATRHLLGRLLAQLGLPDAAGQAMPSPTQVRARRAAEVRWDRWRERRGETA